MPQLYELTASELTELYRSGEVSPVEVAEACLQRYERHNVALNAIVALNASAVMDAASASRERWRSSMPLSELDGIPVTIKDNLVTEGLPATWGSELFADLIPEQDELSVARLRKAGAIIFGKTNVPELALAGYTSNRLFGATGNPWDPSLTPGGSSGGAVAAIMSGMAPIAIATDAGGSIRRPASHAGCVGLKTSIGVVARRDGFPALSADFQTIGPLARSMADLRNVLTCIRGAPVETPSLDLGGLKVAAFWEVENSPVDPQIVDSFHACVEVLRALGITVSEVPSPCDVNAVGETFLDIASAGVATVLSEAETNGREVTPAIAAIAERGQSLKASEYVRQMHFVSQFRWQMHDFFEDWDFLLTPTAAALPWPKEEPFPRTIGGRQASPRASAVYTTFANVAGIPGLSFPFARAQNGLPIGMQLLGPINSDARLLALGQRLEDELGWPTSIAPME